MKCSDWLLANRTVDMQEIQSKTNINQVQHSGQWLRFMTRQHAFNIIKQSSSIIQTIIKQAAWF
jgi:hypothetical protein